MPVNNKTPLPETTEASDCKSSESSSTVDNVGERFGDILSTLSGFRTQITMLQNQIRGLGR